jgi:hypothetical protein
LNFGVLTLTVPGLEAPEKFKILRAFEHLHHFDRPCTYGTETYGAENNGAESRKRGQKHWRVHFLGNFFKQSSIYLLEPVRSSQWWRLCWR